MRLSEFLKLELCAIKKYYREVQPEIYSHKEKLHFPQDYQRILSMHSSNIHQHKARLVEIMDLTDKKGG